MQSTAPEPGVKRAYRAEPLGDQVLARTIDSSVSASHMNLLALKCTLIASIWVFDEFEGI
jgi:hypothetical protein